MNEEPPRTSEEPPRTSEEPPRTSEQPPRNPRSPRNFILHIFTKIGAKTINLQKQAKNDPKTWSNRKCGFRHFATVTFILRENFLRCFFVCVRLASLLRVICECMCMFPCVGGGWVGVGMGALSVAPSANALGCVQLCVCFLLPSA